MPDKKTCFVIQPFTPKYNKRFDDVYEPAIEAAGLRAVRVDREFKHDDFVEAIKKELPQAAVCLVEISEWKKPNVWYELGYAHAGGIRAVLICEKRIKLPSDISTKNVHFYPTDSESDYAKLRETITKSIRAKLKGGEGAPSAEKMDAASSDVQQTPVFIDGLTKSDLVALARIINYWEKVREPLGESAFVLNSRAPSLARLSIEKLREKGLVDVRSITEIAPGGVYSDSEEGYVPTEKAKMLARKNPHLLK